MIELKGRRGKMSTTRVTEAELTDQFAEASGHVTMPDGWTPVGGWIRVSGDKQDERNQVQGVINHCVQREYWIARWYVVHAKGAFKGKQQKDLDRAIEDTREQHIYVLVIPDSSRIERREGKIGTELLNTLAEFTDAGGRVESVAEPTLGQVDIGSRVLTYMTGIMNTEKSKTIKRETRRAYDRIDANHGVRNRIPWGYTYEGTEYERHPVPTEICREYWPQILDRCIAGDSCATIARWLDSEGVKTQKGGKWNQGTILHLIHNPTYCGRRLGWGEDTPLLKDEAVVPVDKWKLANEAIENRPKRGPVAETNRPLLASLKCARCGAPMYRKRIGGRLSRRYAYRCEGQGPQRKGCGNLVSYERLETRVVVSMLTRNDKPYQVRSWVEGTNWDAEIADTLLSIQNLNPVKLGIAEYNRMHAELMTQLVDYQTRNENEAISGGWEYVTVLNDDGSVKTQGQHFFDLDPDERREDLKTHDIRAERSETAADGIRLIIDGEEAVPNPFETALLNTVGPRLAGAMLESQIPNAAEWQALLAGQPIPGSEMLRIPSAEPQD